MTEDYQDNEKDAITHIQDDSSLHKYRTEIPNIVFDLDLSPHEFRLYCEFKRIAGDTGACYKSVRKISESTGIGRTSIKDIKKKLSQPFEKLGGLPLIKIENRITSDGDPDTDYITIVDLWPINFNKNIIRGGSRGAGGGSRDDRGVGHEVTEGGSRGAPKEEPFKKNPKKKKENKQKKVAYAPSPLATELLTGFYDSLFSARPSYNQAKAKKTPKQYEAAERLLKSYPLDRLKEIIAFAHKPGGFWLSHVDSITYLEVKIEKLKGQIDHPFQANKPNSKFDACSSGEDTWKPTYSNQEDIDEKLE